MKIVKRALVVAGIAAALAAIPTQTAGAFWLGSDPGFGSGRHSFVHDPNYRSGPPETRRYIRLGEAVRARYRVLSDFAQLPETMGVVAP